MFYEAELKMLHIIFNKSLVQTQLLDPYAPLDDRLDWGLRRLLGGDVSHSLCDLIGTLKSRVLYTLTDAFHCRYAFLLLPDMQKETLLAVGPYTTDKLSRRQIAELAENYGASARVVKELEMLLGGVPHLPESTPLLYAVLDAFAERIWETGSYITVDISRQSAGLFAPSNTPTQEEPPDTTPWSLQLMERRYACENDLMRAVSNGQDHRAEMLLSTLRDFPFEQRISDRLRNAKNYCIIMNTLLRKAVEQGGVHPLYIDRVSSNFARQIETTAAWEDFMALWQDMVRKYCLLVKKHTTKAYSRLVQQAITRVDLDLTADLSLGALAKSLNVNASYLSTLFKRETGTTVTAYISQKRMEHAAYLLANTKLSIATVAQNCGIQDDNYFTKLFKNHFHATPTAYRREKNRAQKP